MFGPNTLLVVGAGASSEVGLPLGSKLAEDISALLKFEQDVFGKLERGDRDFYAGLRRHFREDEVFHHHLLAARRISDGIRWVNSIDNYIDTHRDDQWVAQCGKAAISYSILREEKRSRLFVDPGRSENKLDFAAIKETWLVPFVRYLGQEVPASEVDNVFSNLTIICFNYDRCIEEFVSHWLENVYRLERQPARELVAKLNIIRPYGAVGPFAHAGRKGEVAFGSDPTGFDFVAASSGLLTYTEQIEDEEILAKMRGAVAEAETIIFLGFAFHPQNMKLLAPGAKTKTKRVLASAYGLSDANVEVISDELLELAMTGDTQKSRRSRLAVHVRNDLKCYDLLSEYSRTIAPPRPS